ncbi:MAG: hypothetical protein RLZZ342_270, partial [Candidatus Parcubacteria bacterium]
MQKSTVRALITGIIVLGTTAGVSGFAQVADTTIPTAHDTPIQTTTDAPVVITLEGVSNDGGSITFATSSSPMHGALDAINGTTVSYIPESGYTGTDSFQFIVTEGATSSLPATVSITIQAPAPPTGTARIVVRNGTEVATSSLVSFPLIGTTSITTTLGTSHEAAASST